MERRVRTGCRTCRRRRVKCDESKPNCSRCRTANFVCEGYDAPQRVSPLASPVAQSSREGAMPKELPWRHTDWRQEQLPLYPHFVTTTVNRLFRTDHLIFWRDQVAQFSYGIDVVYEALLAIGAVHRSSLIACQNSSNQEASRLRVLGMNAYGNALHLLPIRLAMEDPADISANLIVLVLLTCFEVHSMFLRLVRLLTNFGPVFCGKSKRSSASSMGCNSASQEVRGQPVKRDCKCGSPL